METSFFERIKGYKTMVVNGIIVVGGILVELGVIGAAPDAAAVSGIWDNLFGGGMAILAAINMGLRMVTDTKVGSST